MYNARKELDKNLYFSISYIPTNLTKWPVMFTHKLELSGINILKNLSQLDSCNFLTIPHSQRHYVNLTEADHFKAKYVLAIDIADTICGFPQVKANKDYNSNGFVAGWVGLLNYPNNRDKIVFRRYNSSLLIDPDSDYCVIQAYEPISAKPHEFFETCIKNERRAHSADTAAYEPSSAKPSEFSETVIKNELRAHSADSAAYEPI